MSIDDVLELIALSCQAESQRRVAFIESDCAEAMTLQDYGYLDRLAVIVKAGVPPAVASLLEVSS